MYVIKNLYDSAVLDEILVRLDHIQPTQEPLWGTMSVSQMMAHCSNTFDIAFGKVTPSISIFGRLIGSLVKRLIILPSKPFKHNSPTDKKLIIKEERDFEVEKNRLRDYIIRFSREGKQNLDGKRHPFFGKMSAEEWNISQYKHLDHHFRQFNA